MADDSNQVVLDYLIETQQGEIIPKEGRRQAKLKIGDDTYQYERGQPTSDRLRKRLKRERQTTQFKKHLLEKEKNLVIKDKTKQLTGLRTRQGQSETFRRRSAFGNYVNSISITNIADNIKGIKALQLLKNQDANLKNYLRQHNGMKIVLETFGIFVSKKTREEIRHTIKSRRYEITNEGDIPSVLSQMASDIEIMMDRMELSESGLVIKKIDTMTLNYDKYNPTRGGSFLPLPKWVQDKKACINIKNTNDDLCFKYSVQCGVYKVYEIHHACEMYNYKKINDTLNWDNVKFPSSNIDIDTFEENNKGLVSVNVYFLDEEEGKQSILLYRKTKVAKATHHIDLLKIHEGDNHHYVFVKDYNRLMGSQTNKRQNKHFHCHHCLHGFRSEELLKKHEERGCMAVEGQQIVMGASPMFFKNHYKRLKAPFVIYADFECLTVPQTKEATSDSKTYKYQKHRPCGFMINLVNSIDGSSEAFLYRGEDCMDVFVEKIIEVKDKVMKRMKENKEIIMTASDWRDFKTATHCFVCGEEFKEGDKKVRDHCHFTGQYRGCAHDDCNLQFSMRYYKVPVFLHNLKNYDAHLIIQRAHELSQNRRIEVIAQNSEKFITFAFKNLCFKDSFSFLSASLDKLVKLTKYEEGVKRKDWEKHFKHSRKNRYVKTLEDLDLLTEKGVYPYDYFDDYNRFHERSLPPMEAFYSKLTEEHIDERDYQRAVNVWEHFGIADLGQYHDLYLRTDVLLLTDVFENFRELCLEYYGLDPAHYFTLPNFAWDAMLYKTEVMIEPIKEQDMYEMIEHGLRGGMCQVSHKEVKANNKYMDEDYDETKPSNFITYLDANNLYGLAMSQKLPIGEIKWVKKLPTVRTVEEWHDDDNFAYILEVDLDYPEELHDLHSDYPLAPENMHVKESFLSEHQRVLYKHYYNGKEPQDEKTAKLILNLNPKEKYVVHIKTLRFYLEKGMVLKKVHRAVKFKQRAWLKPWIDFNTNKRKQARNDFEKDMFKLMNNAVYGKTMENVRNHMDFELVDTQARIQKCINNPNYKGCHIIHEELAGVEKVKTILTLEKPIYLGMSILDLSKHHMYSFYYDVMKKKYGDKIKLVYTDTDSYVLQTMTDDIFEDWKQIKQHMDFSGYDKNHPTYDPSNKKVLGKFKDETDGRIITEFIALRPKMYCFKIHDEDKVEKKAKGVPKNKVKKDITMEDYENTLHERITKEVNFSAIRSKNHQIYSINQSKVGLTSYDNKRYWINDTTSVPYGFKSIKGG